MLLAGCGGLPEQSPEQAPSPAVASVGDSAYTLKRLGAFLEAHPETLSRDAIERHLLDWVEAQAYAQEAARRGIATDPLVLERMAEVRLRLLRGVLVEQLLAEEVVIDEADLRRWYRRHQDRATLSERQLKLAWYSAQDSTLAAELHRAVAANRLRADQLAREGVRHGKTSFQHRREMDPRWAEDVFSLGYLDLSPLYEQPGGWIFFHVVGQRPAGFVLSLESAEGEIRQKMEEQIRLERQRDFERLLLEDLQYELDLAPLYSRPEEPAAPDTP